MSTTLPVSPLPSGASRAALPSLGVLDVTGADARAFLQGQLSSDVNALDVGAAHYASYNSPKGRMLATLIVWRRTDEHFALVVAADLAEAINRRLSIFVLRAKVTVSASPRALWGVLGNGAADALATVVGARLAAFHSAQRAGFAALALPDGRQLLDAGAALPAEIAALPVVDESIWRWCAIRAGVPMVTAATSDKLIAQAANWELVGGVDFRKGCYPGQEIIARMQYLGRLKERLHGFHLVDGAAMPAAGTPLHQAGRDEAVGIVVNSAPAPAGGSDLLAVVRQEATDAASIEIDGVALTPRALPYAIPALENVRVKL
jgi:folate-binding protein YgfZ